MHVSLAETVKGEITFESEQPNQFVVAPDSVAYGLNDVGRFLFHPPAVKGFAEGFAEPADEGAFAHVGHLCEFVQMLRLMVGNHPWAGSRPARNRPVPPLRRNSASSERARTL